MDFRVFVSNRNVKIICISVTVFYFQPAINMLLSLVRKDGKAEDGKKKKKEEGGILLRPIICICNDQ